MLSRKTQLFAALTLVAGAGLFSSVPSAIATPPAQPVLQDEKPARANVAVGTITALDLENNKFTLKTNGEGDASKEVVVTVTADTKYMLGKDESTREAVLVQGAKVRVRHNDGVAVAVSGMPAKPDKPAKPE